MVHGRRCHGSQLTVGCNRLHPRRSTLSLRGLGPLYSRAAEIFWMGNLSRVTDAQLDRAAQMYDNVTQRMGT